MGLGIQHNRTLIDGLILTFSFNLDEVDGCEYFLLTQTPTLNYCDECIN